MRTSWPRSPPGARARAADRRAADGRRQPRGRYLGAGRASGVRGRRGRRGRDGRPASAPASPLRATTAQAAMELRLTARRGENVLVTIVIPVVVLLFFASVAILPTGDGPPVDFLLPGVLALAIIATSLVNLGIATGYERHYGVLKRLGGSPLTRGGLLAAKVVAVLVVEVAQVVLLVAIAAVALGWRAGPGASLPAVRRRAAARHAGVRRARPAAGRHAPGRGDAGPRQRPVPRVPAARRDHPARLAPARPARRPGRRPAGGGPGRCLPPGARVGRAATSARPFVVLGVWGVAAVGLAIRTFRWE